MEQGMIRELGVNFKAIHCGKMRRYFSFYNAIDMFKIPVGIVQSWLALLRFKPQAVFCKGGYVSFPVALAAWLLRIPVILHESDVTPGMANTLCSRFAKIICLAHEETRKFFELKKPQFLKKIIVTGNPVRRSLALANTEHGLAFSSLSKKKPLLLVMGGSQGAEFINQLIFRNLEYLLEHYEVVHICGKGKMKSEHELQKLVTNVDLLRECYRCFTFVGEELKDLYAAADVVVSRSGALTLAELDFFDKPVLLIPLPTSVSRRDQIENAEIFALHHMCRILEHPQITDEKFRQTLQDLASAPKKTSHKKNKFEALEKITQLLLSPKL